MHRRGARGYHAHDWRAGGRHRHGPRCHRDLHDLPQQCQQPARQSGRAGCHHLPLSMLRIGALGGLHGCRRRCHGRDHCCGRDGVLEHVPAHGLLRRGIHHSARQFQRHRLRQPAHGDRLGSHAVRVVVDGRRPDHLAQRRHARRDRAGHCRRDRDLVPAQRPRHHRLQSPVLRYGAGCQVLHGRGPDRRHLQRGRQPAQGRCHHRGDGILHPEPAHHNLPRGRAQLPRLPLHDGRRRGGHGPGAARLRGGGLRPGRAAGGRADRPHVHRLRPHAGPVRGHPHGHGDEQRPRLRGAARAHDCVAGRGLRRLRPPRAHWRPHGEPALRRGHRPDRHAGPVGQQGGELLPGLDDPHGRRRKRRPGPPDLRVLGRRAAGHGRHGVRGRHGGRRRVRADRDARAGALRRGAGPARGLCRAGLGRPAVAGGGGPERGGAGGDGVGPRRLLRRADDLLHGGGGGVLGAHHGVRGRDADGDGVGGRDGGGGVRRLAAGGHPARRRHAVRDLAVLHRHRHPGADGRHGGGRGVHHQVPGLHRAGARPRPGAALLLRPAGGQQPARGLDPDPLPQDLRLPLRPRHLQRGDADDCGGGPAAGGGPLVAGEQLHPHRGAQRGAGDGFCGLGAVQDDGGRGPGVRHARAIAGEDD
mmetsp:Transcript_28148/g.58709  ORF Transcript_28148/g.58709 Transcript_28148/m.58709 type:complete len:643 (-) Transcript_28148:1727-3655(-)